MPVTRFRVVGARARLLPAEPFGAKTPLILADRLVVIVQAELEWIDAGLGGQFIEEQLGAKPALRVTRRAHRPRGVGVHGEFLVARALLRLARVVVGHRDTAAAAVETATAETAPIPRGDRALVVEARAHLHECGRAIARARVLLKAVEHELDRGVRFFGEQAARERFDAGAELAAETAADELGVYGQRFDFDAARLQCASEFAAHAKRRLRAVPDIEVLAVPLRDATVRLERTVGLHFGAVGARVRDLRRRERAIDVFVGGPFVVDVARNTEHRRVRQLQEVDVVRFGLVGGADLLDRVAHGVQRGARHCGDRVADEAHLVADLLQRDHGADAGHLARFVEFEPGQHAACDRRPQDHRLQHAGERDVIGILRAATGLGDAIGAIHVGAHDRERRVGVPRRRVAFRGLHGALLEPIRLAAEAAVADGDLDPVARVLRFVAHLAPFAVRSMASMMRP